MSQELRRLVVFLLTESLFLLFIRFSWEVEAYNTEVKPGLAATRGWLRNIWVWKLSPNMRTRKEGLSPVADPTNEEFEDADADAILDTDTHEASDRGPPSLEPEVVVINVPNDGADNDVTSNENQMGLI